MGELATLQKGIEILFLFNESSPSLTVVEIAKRMKLGESSTYRYVATLRSVGLLREASAPGKYQLGLGILALARAATTQLDIVEKAIPALKNIVERIGESALLCGIMGTRAICLEKVDCHHGLRPAWERGRAVHLHAASVGKSLLAFLDESERELVTKDPNLPRFTDQTVTDLEALERDLAQVRTDGFSVTDSEITPGVRSVSVPIFDHRDKVIANLTVGGPTDRMDWQLTRKAIALLTEEARSITADLGGKWPWAS